MGWELTRASAHGYKSPAVSLNRSGNVYFNVQAFRLNKNKGHRAYVYIDRGAKLLGVSASEDDDAPYAFMAKRNGAYLCVRSPLLKLGIDPKQQKGKCYPVRWQDDMLVVDFSKTVDELTSSPG